MGAIRVQIDSATAPHAAALIAFHRATAHDAIPQGFAHALGAEALAAPGVTFWTAWDGDDLAAIGALRELGDGHCEVKSMRTAPDHLRKGAGRALLATIIATARARGLTRISLETGTSASFVPANTLYERFGFVDCAAFGDYPPSPHNRFMTLSLQEMPCPPSS